MMLRRRTLLGSALIAPFLSACATTGARRRARAAAARRQLLRASRRGARHPRLARPDGRLRAQGASPARPRSTSPRAPMRARSCSTATASPSAPCAPAAASAAFTIGDVREDHGAPLTIQLNGARQIEIDYEVRAQRARAAMADAGADRERQALPVQPGPGDPQPHLDPDAGQPRHPPDLRRAHRRARRPEGGDERRDADARRRAGRRRPARLPLPHAAADPALSDRDRHRRSRPPRRRPAHRRLGRAERARARRLRIRRHGAHDATWPRRSTAPIAGAATTCWSCRPRFRTAAWRTRASPSSRRPSSPATAASSRSIAHELAHSWSGNLVTNAIWADGWLNEGFTSYIEDRISEAIYGVERARMAEALAWADIQARSAPSRRTASACTGSAKSTPTTIPAPSPTTRARSSCARSNASSAARARRLSALLFRPPRLPADDDASLPGRLPRTCRARRRGARSAAQARPVGLRAGPAVERRRARTRRLRRRSNSASPRSTPAARAPARGQAGARCSASVSCRRCRANCRARGSTRSRARFGLNTHRQHGSAASTGSRSPCATATQPAGAAVERFLTEPGPRQVRAPALSRADGARPWGQPLARRIYAQARATYHPLVQAGVDRIVTAA